MRRILGRVVTLGIAVLFLLRAIGWFCVASSFASMFRHAQNVGPSNSLPEQFWSYVLAGILWLAVGGTYVLGPERIRKWFVVLAGPAVAYGWWTYEHTEPFLLSWSGVFHGDPVAIEAAGAVILMLLGLLGILHWVLERKR